MEEKDQLISTKIEPIKQRHRINSLCNTIAFVIIICFVAFMFWIMLTGLKAHRYGAISLAQHEQILKPLIDKNQHRILLLDNGLKVLLIHNRQATTSKVALSVKVGSFSENEYLGMAHFLEHMVFLGSERYPEPYQFEKFVEENSGDFNAYTGDVETNYYYKISSKQLQKSLDMFSSLFENPLLREDNAEQELESIQNEYEIRVSRGKKEDLLLKLLSSPQHPFSKFSYGNKESLQKEGVHKALRDFYEDNYSSDIMSLVVESNYEISEMENMIEVFNQIKNKQKADSVYIPEEKPFQGQKVVHIRDDENPRSVSLLYYIKPFNQYYKEKPYDLVKQLLLSNNNDGLIQYLKRNNLIVDLTVDYLIADENLQFSVMQLEFIVKHTHHYLQLVQIVNSYLNKIIDEFYEARENFIEDSRYFIQYWHEQQEIESLKFKFNEEVTKDIQEVAHNLNFYPSKYVFAAQSTYIQYDPQIFYDSILDLLDANNLIIVVNDHNSKATISDDLYRIKYSVEELNGENLTFIHKTIYSKNLIFQNEEPTKYELRLPDLNIYIPKELGIKSICKIFEKKSQTQDALIQFQKHEEMVFSSQQDCLNHEFQYEQNYPIPELIHKQLNFKFWWKLDRQQQLPQVFLAFKFQYLKPIGFLELMKLQLNEKLMQGYIDKKFSQANEVNYKIQIKSNEDHLELLIYGWNDKIRDITQSVILDLNDRNLFDQNKELIEQLALQVKIELEDFFEANSYYAQTKQHYLPSVMFERYIGPKHLERSIQDGDFQNIFAHQLQNSIITGYSQGNFLTHDAQEIIDDIQEIINVDRKLVKEQIFTRVFKLQKNYIFPFISASKNSQDPNGSTFVYYQFGQRTSRTNAILNIMQSYFNSQVYLQMRQIQQLGYYVRGSMKPYGCLDGAYIYVQSSKLKPYEVQTIINKFILDFEQFLINLDPEEFQSTKESLITKQRQITLFDISKEKWQHIKNQDYSFEEIEILNEQINQISQDDLVQWYQETFKKANSISIQIYGKGMARQILKGNQRLVDVIKQNHEGDQQILTFEEFRNQKDRLYQSCIAKLSDL